MTRKPSPKNQYQKLFTEIVAKTNQNEIFSSNSSTTHQRTNSFFYNPSKNTNEQNSKYKRTPYHQKTKSVKNSFDPNTHILKKTTYFVFGEASPAKSVEMRKTFVNLGNNRYRINRSPQPQFNKTGDFYLQNMDLDKSTFIVNNITFPIITQKLKANKTVTSNFPRNEFNLKGQNQIKTFSKKKRNQLENSLEINNRFKINNSPSFSTKPIQKTDNPEFEGFHLTKQNISVYNIGQAQKRQSPVNDYWKQITFAKQYQKKLFEMEKNIVVKKIERFKQNRSIKQGTQKFQIEAWKHQFNHQDPVEEMQEFFDDLTSKPLF